jgi:hypothetical protein
MVIFSSDASSGKEKLVVGTGGKAIELTVSSDRRALSRRCGSGRIGLPGKTGEDDPVTVEGPYIAAMKRKRSQHHLKSMKQVETTALSACPIHSFKEQV